MLADEGPASSPASRAIQISEAALRALCANFEAGRAEAIDGDDGGGVLQNALNPLMLLRAECCGFAAIPFARLRSCSLPS